MTAKNAKNAAKPGASEPAADAETASPEDDQAPEQAKDIGGRDGPDPTRYGDWEKAGRCIDF